MNKSLIAALALMLTGGIGVSQAQTVTDSWAFGAGLSYPRFYSVNITALNSGYGAYLSLQRNFSEHVGLRTKVGYSYLEGQWNDASLNLIDEKTNLLTGDLDFLYYLVPCAPVSPYLFAGVGGHYKDITNGQTASPHNWGSQLNAGGGAEFKINPDWSVVTECSYHETNKSLLDGTVVPTEMNGRDSYIVLSIGFNFFFGKGGPSKQCETCPCQAITPVMKDQTDYNRIEEMIVKHIPREIIKDVVVDKYVLAFKNDLLVLVGVNFAFDKSDLLPESYPVLDKSVTILNEKENANAKFEVEGYTDYIGTVAYNQELSVERAQVVKAYLVSKGIEQNRLTCVGYGKYHPVADNATEDGRALNRRIVFKMIR
jgi:outer membrane protein OmpA-like peptidoglycan-associated protein/opacity protein-like surface antigen